nr:hypothetical protein [Morchella crassipes]
MQKKIYYPYLSPALPLSLIAQRAINGKEGFIKLVKELWSTNGFTIRVTNVITGEVAVYASMQAVTRASLLAPSFFYLSTLFFPPPGGGGMRMKKKEGGHEGCRGGGEVIFGDRGGGRGGRAPFNGLFRGGGGEVIFVTSPPPPPVLSEFFLFRKNMSFLRHALVERSSTNVK